MTLLTWAENRENGEFGGKREREKTEDERERWTEKTKGKARRGTEPCWREGDGHLNTERSGTSGQGTNLSLSPPALVVVAS